MASYTYYTFAQAYGEGSYNSCTYNNNCTTGATGAGNSGGLVNTGVAVAGVVTIACLIVAVAIVVRVWRRTSSRRELQAQAQEQDAGLAGDDTPDQSNDSDNTK